MVIFNCTTTSGMLAFVLATVIVTHKRVGGGGIISADSLMMIGWIISFVLFFFLFWFPSLIVGRVVARKSLSQPQKDTLFCVAFIAAVFFCLALAVVYNITIDIIRQH